MAEHVRHRARFLMASGLPLLINACMVGPNFVPPRPPVPAVWEESAGSGLRVSGDRAWWSSFGDPSLDRLIARADNGNLALKIAMERVNEARAQRGIAAAGSAPALGAQASYSHYRLSTEGIAGVARPLLGIDGAGADTGPQSVSFDDYSIGAAASWEIDLWGRQRRLREAAGAALEASRADRDGARLSVQAEIARTYFQWRLAKVLLHNADTAVSLAEQGLQIEIALVSHGLAARADLVEPDRRLHTARNLHDQVAIQASIYRRALALLAAGRPDAQLPELDEPPVKPAIGETPATLPSAMARERPDIRAAEARLHAATAAISVAQADFYPSISLTGQFSLDALKLSELGWGARNTGFGPSINLPIFMGGRLRRQLELRQSEQRSAALAYQATVIAAWREVEDALATDRMLRNRVAALDADLNAQGEKTNMLKLRAERGDIRQSVLLDARGELLDAQSRLEKERTAMLTARVDLITALGGGLQPAEPHSNR